MTYAEFKKKYNGKYTDFDGAYGCQCWDLAQRYVTEVLGLPRSILDGCGLVSNMLYPPKREILDQYFDEVPINKMTQGDLCIWEYGHIAIFDHYDGKLWYFSQNPNPCQVMVIERGGVHAFRKKAPKPVKHNIGYKAHVQNIGWQDWKYDGETAGTTGKSLRMEALRIDYDKPIYAKAHIQNIGWKDFGKITKDTIIGTVGQQKQLECLCLKGNFKYRVHIGGYGWTCWTNADGICTLGTVGQKLRIEAIQIKEL